MLTGIVTLKWSAGDLTVLPDDLDLAPVFADLDILVNNLTSLSKNVTPRSPNTYLVVNSYFLIVFFDLLPVFILYYELLYDRFVLDPDSRTRSQL